MYRILNRTPFDVALMPSVEPGGRDFATVLVKGTFRADGGAVDIAAEQGPLLAAATYTGRPGASSIRYESDMCPPKPSTDIAVVGRVFTSSKTRQLDLSFRVGALERRLRVWGARVYRRRALGWALSSPELIEEIPLCYERAFGGADLSAENPDHHDWEARNHIGVGFVAEHSTADLEGQALPNFENPDALLQHPGDRPGPVGLGFIAPQWEPRVSYAGTYDDAWRTEVCPWPPDDLDARFFQAAHPDCIAPIRGGEAITITHALPGGRPFHAHVPTRSIHVQAKAGGREQQLDLALQTLLIEPLEGRLQLTWAGRIECGRDLLDIDYASIEDAAAKG